MIAAWYIDALDARGGRAVATFRDDKLIETVLLFDTGPSIFVGPPLFVPELLRSRASGFGLARGRAQLGLFLEGDGEVPFPDVAAVAEFVRRAYLSGSSGDGPGESGGGPPRAPDGGTKPPELEPSSIKPDNDPVKKLIALANSCTDLSKHCEPGKSQPLTPTICHPSPGASGRLLRGAHRIVFELLGRVRSGANLDLTVSAQRLIGVFCRLGISGRLGRHPPGDIAPEDIEGTSPAVDHLFNLLLAEFGLAGAAYRPMLADYCGACVPAADPFDDLGFLPVPSFGRGHHADNLQALLSAYLATPALTIGSSTHDPDVPAEVVLFAACYLVLGDDRSLGLYASNPAAWAAMADHLVERALGWVASNAPRILFEPRVEALIAAASSLPA